MQYITVEELINYKILPFNLYTKGDKVLFAAGEILTPGKFLRLRHVDILYRKLGEAEYVPPAEKEEIEEEEEKKAQEAPLEPETPTISEPIIDIVKPEIKVGLSVDEVIIDNVVAEVNKNSVFPAEEQIKLKVFFQATVGDITKVGVDEVLPRMKNLRDKILNDYIEIMDNAIYSSQLRLIGEYDRSHAINVALLTNALARKLGKSEDFVSDVTMAALLHDIGKSCLPQSILDKQQGMTIQEQKLYQAHTKIGYNIIKNKMNLNERIAKVALEHHEKNDGTGFPMGKSGESISIETQIVSLCNHFDNLVFNKTAYKVYNTKEALKYMLELGSKNFATDILYTFIYMYNYDDTRALDDMALT